MSAATDQGTGAFDYGKQSSGTTAVDCDRLQVVSTATGRLGWSAPLVLDGGPAAGGSPDQSGGKALSIGDGVVSAPYYGSADAHGQGADPDLLAASLQTGKEAWTTNDGQNRLADGCVLTGVAQVFDAQVYALGDCNAGQVDLLTVGGTGGGGGPAAPAHVVGPLGDCALASASSIPGFLVSDTGYLLVACPGENQDEGLYALKRGSARLMPLDSSAASAVTADAGGNQPTPGGVVMDGSNVYLTEPGVPGSTEGSSADTVEAISLATGRQVWTHSFPGATDVAALAATAGDVQVAAVYSSASTVDVVTLGADGAVSSTLILDAAAQSAFSGLSIDSSEPYAVTVNGRTTLAFPGNAGSARTAVGELR
jgi:hypothetical protein